MSSNLSGWQRDLDELDSCYPEDESYQDASAAVAVRYGLLARIVEAARSAIGQSEALATALSDLDRHDAERDEAWRRADEPPPAYEPPPRPLWHVECRLDGVLLECATVHCADPEQAAEPIWQRPGSVLEIYSLPEWAEMTTQLADKVTAEGSYALKIPDSISSIAVTQYGPHYSVRLWREGEAISELACEDDLRFALYKASQTLAPREPVVTVPPRS